MDRGSAMLSLKAVGYYLSTHYRILLGTVVIVICK